jgi:predicted transposase YdaD
VNFEENELNIKFEEEIKLLTNKSETMGITEQILDIAKQDGIREGAKSSMERISKNLLKEGLDIHLINKATSMPIKQLEKLKKQLLVD